MKLTGNTILITGGGSGIGRGLAEAFHALGNKVIIAGRRKKALEETCDANHGMACVRLDIDDARSVRDFAAELLEFHPEMNVLINNAGITRREDLKAQPAALADSEAIISTNVLGPVRLTAALLPHLQKQARATIVNVSSGLGFVPFPAAPTYSATKAFLHSYTESLRFQLRGTSVEVLEIIPPYVQTEFGGPHQAVDPRAMPLKDFIAETMQNFASHPDAKENCTEKVRFLRDAVMTGAYDQAFEMLGSMTFDDPKADANVKV